jgi:lysozyme
MNYPRLKAALLRDEGFRSKVYSDVDGKPARDPKGGKLTVGIGRNLEDRGLTEKEALFLLENDIYACEADLDRAIPWWRTRTEPRQEAMVNMCFNLGIKGFLGFKNTLEHIKAGRYEQASRAMMQSKWARQVGVRAQRLAKQILTGEAQ